MGERAQRAGTTEHGTCERFDRVSRTLVVTNDFPPRHGGIETFVFALCQGLPAEDVVVYTSRKRGQDSFDAGLPYHVMRDRSQLLLPTPSVARHAQALLQAHGCTGVLYGASAPLGLLASALRSAGASQQVAMTHGHEVWWAQSPGTRGLLRRIGEHTDALTYVSDWCRDRIAPALTPEAAQRMRRLSPGVDVARFYPGAGGAELRARLGIDPDRPLIVCVGRIVARKGQDTLVRAMPAVLAKVPEALLLIVGDGPHRKRVAGLVAAENLSAAVWFTGSVPGADLPAYFDAADVFAMPCRARLGGLEAEAWGIVFLEAQACGVPVVVGDSGGAPESCVPDETGFIVNPENPDEVAARLVTLLADDALRARMGKAARSWAEQWTWPSVVATLQTLF
jgi:phosphatidyl-myo-inositol dimannoside synthase